jgi:hypothetical protein
MKKFVPPVKKAVEPTSIPEPGNAPVVIAYPENAKVANNKRGQPEDNKEVNKRRKSIQTTSQNRTIKSNDSDMTVESLCIIVEASSAGTGDWTEPQNSECKFVWCHNRCFE